MSDLPILSLLTWLPLCGAVMLYLVPIFSPQADAHGNRARIASITVSLIVFALACVLLWRFDPASSEMQFVERSAWIPPFGASYALGVDGISLFLVALTAFLMPIVFCASGSIHHMRRGYCFSMLALQTAMTGTLLALDLLLFYLFWEFMLAPMYFIIGIWGGKRRIYASLKFVLYTVFGSVLMLVAMVYLVWQNFAHTGTVTFDLAALLNTATFTHTESLWLFAAFALAFCIKVPLFPFHTWLPDAHVEAPTGGSVVLAGVLLKMGLYGLIRFAYPLFPDAAQYFGPLLAGLAVIGIVYGALVAWAQTDIKKLVAYSSVSHLGYCVLGFAALNSIGVSGSIYQMLNHGISTGALFLIVGVLYDRKHTRAIADYSGLTSKVPVFAFLFLVFTLSSIALPLTNGFIGEFLILTGSFASFPRLTVVALLGVVLGAVYMLTLYLKTMFGEIDNQKNGDLKDVTRTELWGLIPLLVMVFVMGLYPQPILSRMQPSVDAYLRNFEKRKQMVLEVHRSNPGPSQPSQSANVRTVSLRNN